MVAALHVIMGNWILERNLHIHTLFSKLQSISVFKLSYSVVSVQYSKTIALLIFNNISSISLLLLMFPLLIPFKEGNLLMNATTPIM